MARRLSCLYCKNRLTGFCLPLRGWFWRGFKLIWEEDRGFKFRCRRKKNTISALPLSRQWITIILKLQYLILHPLKVKTHWCLQRLTLLQIIKLQHANYIMWIKKSYGLRTEALGKWINAMLLEVCTRLFTTRRVYYKPKYSTNSNFYDKFFYLEDKWLKVFKLTLCDFFPFRLVVWINLSDKHV